MAPLEGALRVRADGGRFVLETVDYGQPFRLLSAETESEITERSSRTCPGRFRRSVPCRNRM